MRGLAEVGLVVVELGGGWVVDMLGKVLMARVLLGPTISGKKGRQTARRKTG